MKVLARALELVPGSRIIAVGPKMEQAVRQIENGTGRFYLAGNAAEAGDTVRSAVRKGDIVFLKASHSMNLSAIEPAEEEEKI